MEIKDYPVKIEKVNDVENNNRNMTKRFYVENDIIKSWLMS